MPDIRTFLMMGRPGSGKGTQAKLLAKKIGAEVYSSGNRLREMAKGHGFVNEKIRKTMEEGALLPAWFSSHLFVETLLGISPEDRIVFEGACRRLEEAEAFDETAAWLERPYRAVFLNISDAEVEKRISLRKGQQGRSDDASDTVEHRLKEYEEHTAHAVELFRSKGLLLEINADQPIEAVHAEILKTLNLA
jgi:adenylate kinase